MYYSLKDRKAQLKELKAALEELLPVVAGLSDYADSVESYRAALVSACALLENGFTQEQAMSVGKSVPDMFYRHKDWVPPSRTGADGAPHEEEWFVRAEPKLQAVLAAAGRLAALGFY